MSITPDQDLHRTEAIAKIREISTAAGVGFLGTCQHNAPLRFDPMVVQSVDDAGVVWFLSGRSSERNRRIAENSHVYLLITNPADSQYLSLTGAATLSDSLALREKCWSPQAKTWFPQGVTDPELTVIAVRIEDGHYWDAPHGKARSWLMAAVVAVTGRAEEVGVEGSISVSRSASR